MVTIFGCDARQLSRLRAACAPAAPVTATSDWVAFEDQVACSECAVIALEWLSDADDFAHLLALRARLPLQPIVLLTRRDADNARWLKDVFVDEVVWQDEAAHELWPAIRRARAHGVLGTVAAAFQRADGVPPPLRRALAFACRNARPVYTVSQLMGVAGCDRRTLWRYWRDASTAPAALSLQEVLDWLLLLRAAGRKTADVSWCAVAEELGVHEHTLGRLAYRLTRQTLREVAARGADSVLLRFSEQVLAPVSTRNAVAPANTSRAREGSPLGHVGT